VDLVALFPVYTALWIVWMVLSGWALDRYGAARLMSFFQLPMMIALLILCGGDNAGRCLCWAFFLAITARCYGTLPNAF